MLARPYGPRQGGPGGLLGGDSQGRQRRVGREEGVHRRVAGAEGHPGGDAQVDLPRLLADDRHRRVADGERRRRGRRHRPRRVPHVSRRTKHRLRAHQRRVAAVAEVLVLNQLFGHISVGLERVSLVGASGVSQTRRGPLLNHDWPARRPAADTPEPDGPPTGLAPVPTLGQLCLSERSDLHEPKSADRSGLPLSPAVEEAKSGREQAGSPGEEQEEEAETEEPQLDRSTEPSRSNFEEAVAVAGGKQRVILRAAMRQRGPLSSSGTSPTRERRRGRRRQRWRVNGQSDAATSPTTASAGDAASESSVEDADELPPPRAPPQWGNDASASSSECGPRAEQAMEELAGACRDVALDGSTQSSSAATPAARTPEDSGRRSAPSRAWAGGSPTDEQRTATPARLRRLPPQKAEVSEGLLRVRRRRELRRAAEQKWRTLICEEQPSDAWLLSQTSVAVCMPRTAAEDMLCAAPLLAPSHRARSCKPRRGPTPVTVGRLRQSSTVLSAGSRLAAGLDWAGQESKRNGAALWDEGSGEESETEGAAAETPTEQSAWSPVECGTVTGPLTPAAAQDDQSAVPSWEDLPHQAQSDFRESLAASALFSAKAKKAERRWSAAPRKSASRVPSQRRSLLRPRVASFDVPLHESELLEQSGFGTPCGFPHTAAR
eukprot:TRINITY_DN26153_c0_g1_i1.p1 TRINITY_DN26153_c0_g1~~TRINITY_DN26153_c0_g1_i1.p1  ORF type:complete len:662 (+),score=132.08 TRINITY_DN26153_c0_g1_i1:463-2448(+)